jgi:hypothetical protein
MDRNTLLKARFAGRMPERCLLFQRSKRSSQSLACPILVHACQKDERFTADRVALGTQSEVTLYLRAALLSAAHRARTTAGNKVDAARFLYVRHAGEHEPIIVAIPDAVISTLTGIDDVLGSFRMLAGPSRPFLPSCPSRSRLSHTARQRAVGQRGFSSRPRLDDLVLYLIARHVGATAAQTVARYFALQWHHDGLAHYIVFQGRRDHGDAAIATAQGWRSMYFSV